MPLLNCLRQTHRLSIHLKFLQICLLYGLLCLASLTGLAAPSSSPSTSDKQQTFQRWAALPIIMYDNEAGLQLGGMLVRFFQPKNPQDRTPSVDIAVFGSTNKQYVLSISPNLYFDNNKYHLNGFLSGSYWPANYYGIGNDTPDDDDPEVYEASNIATKVLFERQWQEAWYVGGIYQYIYETFDLEGGRVLETGSVLGVDGKNHLGLGLTFSYDSRDNANDARSGTYFRLESTRFDETIGSDFDYSLHEFQLNRYMPLANLKGVAIGGYLRVTQGDVPFRYLSSPNGSTVLRGVENGRFRDRDLAAFSSEYRFPIRSRWGGVFFIETAQVAPHLKDLTAKGWRYSLGGGVRYAVNPSERFNIRFDFSYVEQRFGLAAINIREAF